MLNLKFIHLFQNRTKGGERTFVVEAVKASGIIKEQTKHLGRIMHFSMINIKPNYKYRGHKLVKILNGFETDPTPLPIHSRPIQPSVCVMF